MLFLDCCHRQSRICADGISRIHDYFVCSSEGYRFDFNKRGKDGTAKANITGDANSQVWGVCYEVDKDALDILDRYEGGYQRKDIVIKTLQGEECLVTTYVSDKVFDTPTLPSEKYFYLVFEGAKEQDLPASYCQSIENLYQGHT